ncbi:NOP protein chaperone 1-like [Homarus americanus]|uniref:Uncharacterized protein n=1 Tax=Homarus americanus TaxID=6706 RepID=A0A8J5T6P7_HOMAM|nr:NOP protein chaperone 1-like [Homarus americanus]KAG7172830.1 hypothetical protein Hamer_G022825 [Homarus americanus]
MDMPKKSSSNSKRTSKELLSVTGDGSSHNVVKSLLRGPPKTSSDNKPRTFKVARSPLLDQVQAFLPDFQKSTQKLLAQPKEKLQDMDIENTLDDSKVIEMNVVVGEMGPDTEDSDEELLSTSSRHDSDNDSESEAPVRGPVTASNIKIPSEATGGKRKRKNLIQVVSDSHDEEKSCKEDDKSDSEMTVASTSSGER